ncbi:MAG: hypothetical protein ACR2RF_04575 [Geminicoccaceae bacterium]
MPWAFVCRALSNEPRHHRRSRSEYRHADNDEAEGSGEDDRLTGETGNDVLTGGSDADRFIFAAGACHSVAERLRASILSIAD